MSFEAIGDDTRQTAGVCGQNICYHDAVFVIPFDLICNMTISEKVEF